MLRTPKRISVLLPNPSNCDNCGSLNIRYTTNDVIYGQMYGEWPQCWFCDDCRASVGCHPKTSHPLGRMADRATKKLRKDAHDVFDVLWQSGLMTRDRAYIWLANELNIEPEEAHIALLNKDQLKQVITASKVFFDERQNIIDRRKAKRNEQQRKQDRRESQRIGLRKRTGK